MAARRQRVHGSKMGMTILVRDPRSCTGNAFIDDQVLAEAGVTDLERYTASDDAELALDLFVSGWPDPAPPSGL
jgi:hypothetical protein